MFILNLKWAYILLLKQGIKQTMVNLGRTLIKMALVFSICIPMASAADQTAFKIFGKKTSLEELKKEDQSAFYDIDKKKYELIERFAQEKFLDSYWEKMAKERGKPVSTVRQEFFEKNVKVTDQEVQLTLDRFKDNPQLSKLPKEEQKRQVRAYLREKTSRDLIQNIIQDAIKKGDLDIVYPRPKEPRFKLTVRDTDQVRYGPKPDQIEPIKCAGNKCPITIIEYSEYQCPFCERVQPDVKRVLTNYKGKIRWIVRDFPLNFHSRAKPAAVAATCAGFQKRYWQMYEKLFENQNALTDADFKKYAKDIGVNMAEWEKCVANPQKALTIIDRNYQSGVKLGVTGTPAFFINGRRISGAQPYAAFERIIEDELKTTKKM